MKKLKIRLLGFLNFCCMFVVLGTQALLDGSWTVREPKPVKAEGVGNDSQM